ncbi:MAG: hypothetical protein AAGF53_18975 [Pseudomonadota bacterium]
MQEKHWIVSAVKDLQQLAQQSSMERVASALDIALEVAELELQQRNVDLSRFPDSELEDDGTENKVVTFPPLHRR